MPGPDTGFHRIATQHEYRGRFLQLDSLTIAAPDGEQFVREVLRQRDAAAALPYDDGDVVLIRQYRAAVDALSLEIPAGVCDRPGEAPEETARRECAEEVGYRPRQLVPIATVLPAPGYASEQVHVYLALDLEPGPPAPEGPEERAAEVVRLPFDDAVAMVAAGEIRNASTVVALYAVAARRAELLGP